MGPLDGRMSANPILLEAIALKKCIGATYNRVEMLLAPHILYSKNGAFYIEAVTIEKNGAPPREQKMGAFHLSGLSDVALTEQHFERAGELFDPELPRYQDGATLFSIDG